MYHIYSRTNVDLWDGTNKNADKMSKLRAYKLNGGNIRTLIDNQRNRIDFKLNLD